MRWFREEKRDSFLVDNPWALPFVRKERQTLWILATQHFLAAAAKPSWKVNFALAQTWNAYSWDRKHIFLHTHITGILLDFGEELFASNMFAVGHFHLQAGKQEQQDDSGEVKGGKLLLCQNNEICDSSTNWVKDTHSVLSVMLSSWHLGKLHLCRGHKAKKHNTSLGHCDRRLSLLAKPIPHPDLNPFLYLFFPYSCDTTDGRTNTWEQDGSPKYKKWVF